MTVTFTDLGATTLNGSITNSALTLTIPSGDVSKFPSSGNFYISVDNGANIELMIVTAGQGTATWTVTRGISPTTPVAHNNTAPITEIVGAATLTSFVQNPMTAAGQMIAGGASGAPVAVAAPTASTQVVSAVNGAPFLAAPSAPSLATATTGGTVAAGVYQCELSLVNAQGETVASASASITTTGTTSTITVTSPAAAGSGTQVATGWYAYVTQAGGSTYTRQQTAGSPTAIGTNLTISAPPTSGGANPPGSNTAGTLIPGWATAVAASSSLTTVHAELATDVTTGATWAFTDVLSLALAAGTWMVYGKAYMLAPGSAQFLGVRLYDSTNSVLIDYAEITQDTTWTVTLPLLAQIVVASTITLKMQGTSGGTAATVKASSANITGSSSASTRLTAIKVA